MKQIQIFPSLVVLATGLFFLSGCGDITLTNLTPKKLPKNPSRIYTLSVDAQINNGAVDRGSMGAEIVIDGKAYPMEKSEAGKDIYEFDYRLPGERRDAKYFYKIKYSLENIAGTTKKEVKSALQQFTLSNRYVITLESERAPVGATIPVLGRGFTEFDKIVLGEDEAITNFVSESQLSFIVPTLEAGKTYKVSMEGAKGREPIGNFRVDPSTINVIPKMLSLQPGQKELMIFQIQFEAPPGGLFIDVKTDVPNSVKMPEVIVPGGARTVSINVQGGEPGSGSIVIRMPGFEEVVIPVQVL
tara:strand:- start:151 stop:1053 length:903 start_codon:yes stop_codon:yes gene_type:complete